MTKGGIAVISLSTKKSKCIQFNWGWSICQGFVDQEVNYWMARFWGEI